MKRLFFLLALAFPCRAQVQLTWQQPANPGWTTCSPAFTPMCLYGYVIVDSSTGQLFVVPFGALSYSAPATVGTHTYAIWLGGIDAKGNFTSSMPPATTTVKVTQ